jgi:hypothetical protein
MAAAGHMGLRTPRKNRFGSFLWVGIARCMSIATGRRGTVAIKRRSTCDRTVR